jgi:hypothetical protein
MFLIKRLIQLRLQGKSLRSIATALSLTRKTVGKYATLLQEHNLPDLLNWSEEALARLVQPQTAEHFSLPGALRHPLLYQAFPDYEKQLARTGFTRRLLWQDYCFKAAERGEVPLAYTQFCFHFNAYCRSQKVVLHLEHKAGAEMMVDFAGKKIPYLQEGEVKQAELFVAVLPCSGMCFVWASQSQKKAHFLHALSLALTFFEGVPEAIVVDNLRSAIDKADRYEAAVNEGLQSFAAHYQTTIHPARSRKPTDKAYVERTIGILYSRLHAALPEPPPSLSALNAALVPLLEKHNQAILQGKNYSRRMRFEELEKEALKPLPERNFVFKTYAYAKVNTRSHVLLREDKHYYSVPFALLGEEVKLIYDTETVEIYCHNKRVAAHLRSRLPDGYTTLSTHLPLSHQHYLAWSDAYFEQEAQLLGGACVEMIQKLLGAKGRYKQACYKSCAGLLSLGRKYGKDRLEAACERALAAGLHSYQGIRSILEKGLEQEKPPEKVPPLPRHENIRGAAAYQ